MAENLPAFDPNLPTTDLPDDAVAALPAFDSNLPTTDLPEDTALPDFDPSKPTERFYTLDDIKATTPQALADDPDFRPIGFSVQNEGGLQQDPDAQNRVAEAYEIKERRGSTILQKGKKAATGFIPAISRLAKGALGAGETLRDITFGVPKLAAAAVTGGLEGLKKKGTELAGEIITIPASLESNVASYVDLGGGLLRAGAETAKGVARAATGPGSVTEAVGSLGKTELTPEEFRARYFSDLGSAKAAAEAARGQGPALEALGLDADNMAKVGITVDQAKIEEMAIPTDPLNFVPLGAAVGVVGKTGRAIGKNIIARTATEAQAASLAKILNEVKTVASKGATAAEGVFGATIEAGGKALERAGKASQRSIGRFGGGIVMGGIGAILGRDVYSALAGLVVSAAVPAALKKAGKGVQQAGRIFAGKEVAPAPLALAGEAIKQGAIGTAEGALLTAPFVIGARTEDEENLLGMIPIAGVARAGAKVVPAAVRVTGAAAQNKLASEIFRTVEQAPAPITPNYGTVPELDVTHASSITKAEPQARNFVNLLRSKFEGSPIEIYSIDKKTMAHRTGNENASGFAIEAGTKTNPDGATSPVFRILLDESSEALPHEAYHAFEFLEPSRARAFEKTVADNLTPQQLENFGNTYDAALNVGKPEAQWTRLTPQGIAKEVAAEAFSRIILGQDLSGVPTSVRKQASLFASGLLEKLGAPLARTGVVPAVGGSDIGGVRAGTSSVKLGQDWIAGLFGRLEKDGELLPTLEQAPLPLTEQFRLQGEQLPPQSVPSAQFLEQSQLPLSEQFRLEGEQLPPQPASIAPRPQVLEQFQLPMNERTDAGGQFQLPLGERVPPVVVPEPITIEQIRPSARKLAAGRKKRATTADIIAPTILAVAPATPNLRVAPAQLDAFARRAADTKIPEAIASAVKLEPDIQTRVAEINAHLEAGSPVLEIEHRGVTSEGAEGRAGRRAEQEAAYIAEGLGAAPEEVRTTYQKTFVPVRWEIVKDKPQLLAMSLDKAIANISRAVRDAETYKVAGLIPYESAGGKLTDVGWREAAADLTAYSKNQANGFQGGGDPLVRPATDVGLSIPAETPGYVPISLSKERADFQNLIMGLATPLTAREIKGQIPGNVKGQLLAEANLRGLEIPTAIRPENITKQEFKSVSRRLMEVNPLRNKLAEAGVPVRELIEVTERINSPDIISVKPRPELDFAAPVTDIIRGGFRPAPNESVAAYGQRILEMDDATFASTMNASKGGLTGLAYDTGLALKDKNDLTILKGLADTANAAAQTAMANKDFAAAMPLIMRAQFFREALEAATNTGSAATMLPRLRPGEISPFPPGSFRPGLSPIKEAAIRTPGGEIFTGAWHGEAAIKLTDAFGKGLLKESIPDTARIGEDGDVTGFGEDGFVTNSGEFLNREEAFERAAAIKQIRLTEDETTLRSERWLESGVFDSNRNFRPGLSPIKQAAVRTPGGEIFGGVWHGEARMNMADAIGRGELKEVIPREEASIEDFGTDGFLDHEGNFLTRTEAFDRAKAIKQINLQNVKEGSVLAGGELESNAFQNRRRFFN